MFCAATFTRTAVVLLVCCLMVASAAQAQNFTDIKPSPQQVAWQDLEFGVIIHFGPNTFMDREWGEGHSQPTSIQSPAVRSRAVDAGDSSRRSQVRRFGGKAP